MTVASTIKPTLLPNNCAVEQFTTRYFVQGHLCSARAGDQPAKSVDPLFLLSYISESYSTLMPAGSKTGTLGLPQRVRYDVSLNGSAFSQKERFV